jgi:hypothetical protein
MRRKLLLSIIAVIVSGTTASAADLPTQSRLGAVFADPPARLTRTHPVAKAYPVVDDSAFMVARLYLQPPVPGYYGKPSDFYYSTYYGTSPWVTFGRLPYACKFYGTC